ncbi:MAG: peptidase T [Spirochaetes bacterium]|nr:peptidase T [Spirochaetota bacterium]
MKNLGQLLSDPMAGELIERLVRYAKIETTSDAHVEAIPSTATQWDLARLLVDELAEIGVEDVSLDEHCYLIARIPASPGCENATPIGFMAHMDTSGEVSGKDVKPRVVERWDGRPVKLSEGRVLDPAEYEELADYSGDTIVVTDGTTLLGADDKAGIAEIMAAVRHFLSHPEAKHGLVEIMFTPDEETGKGMNLFPASKIASKACYTLDGGRRGEIETECFNAYEVNVRFTGKSIHPGYARGKMVNAVSMAASYVTMLPQAESPEGTDGWYGYWAAMEISGGVESAGVHLIVRDFTHEGMTRRLEACEAFAKAVEARFPGGKAEIQSKFQYMNMRRKLDDNPIVLERLFEAARDVGAEPYSKPIRGGTDGARLTELGIPTPNLFAGMHNFHSRHEWASASEMVLATRVLIKLAELWTR